MTRGRLRLLLDERGAILVFGVFATFLVAILVYGALGIARALLDQATASDAVDRAALGSAVFFARGMNALVYLNWLMAGLIAVLVGLRLAEGLLTVGAIVLYSLAWPTFGATVPIAGLATEKAIALHQTYERAKKVIYPILEGLHEVEEALSVAVPPLALLDSLRSSTDQVALFALPTDPALPVEWDEFSRLCGKGAELGTRLALLPLKALGGDAFLAPVYGAAEEMGTALSGYLCGDGRGEPPTHEQTVDRHFPRSPASERCERTGDERSCAMASREMEDARHSEHTGACLPTSDCRRGGTYERLALLARHQCDPTRQEAPSEWIWQLEETTVVWRAQAVGGRLTWVEERRQTPKRTRETTARPPCGPNGSVADEYAAVAVERLDSPMLPVCSERRAYATFGGVEADDELPPPMRAGETLSGVERVVTHILGCTVRTTEEIELAEKGEHFEGGEEKAPVRIENDLELGDEAFQIRAIGYAEFGTTTADIVHRLARDRREPPSLVESLGPEIPPVFVAQAEYYFDHGGEIDRSEWMWDPRWTGRLVRFRLPEEGVATATEKRRSTHRARNARLAEKHRASAMPTSNEDSCRKSGATRCDSLGSDLSLLEKFLVH